MSSNTIRIDLDLHKAIERHRRSLDESQTDIVRRLLKEDGNVAILDQPVDARESIPTRRLPRRGGTYRVQILNKQINAHSLKEILKQSILWIEEKRPGFIEKLAQHRTSRGRRIVARKPEELYPGKSSLVKNCAENLNSKWWYDTNISNAQCQRYLNILAQIEGLAEPILKTE